MPRWSALGLLLAAACAGPDESGSDAGQPPLATCEPATCESLGACGGADDGCGGHLWCAPCQVPADDPTCSADGWCLAHPGPNGEGLTSVTGTHDQDVWVSTHGPLAWHWDGARWQAHRTNADASLWSLWAAGRDEVWGIAGNAVMRWDGIAWREQQRFEGGLFALHGHASGRVFVAERRGHRQNVLHVWDGSDWTELGTAEETPVQLFATSADEVWWLTPSGYGLMRWDGKRFAHATPYRPEWGTRIRSAKRVWGSGPDDVWVVGDDGAGTRSETVVWHWDGAQWSDQLRLPYRRHIRGFYGFGRDALSSDAELWLHDSSVRYRLKSGIWNETPVGGSVEFAWAAKSHSLWGIDTSSAALFRHNNVSWKPVEPRPVEALNGVWAASASEVWTSSAWTTQRWDGSRWETLPLDGVSYPRGITGFQDRRFLYGEGLAEWDGAAWRALPFLDCIPDCTLETLVVRGPDDFIGLMSEYEHREVAEWTCIAWDGSHWTPCDREDARALYTQPDGKLWSGRALSRGTLPGLASLGLNEWVRGLWGSLTDGLWAVGRRGNTLVGVTPISFYWDGATWAEHPLPGPELPGTVWSNGRHVWAPGERGSIRRWDGKRWVREETPTWVDLHSIHGADGVVWVVGDAGIVLRRKLEL